MPQKISIISGYVMPYEDLEAWSAREAETNPVYRRCLKREDGDEVLALEDYIEKKKFGYQIELHLPRMAEHGACSLNRCTNSNFMLYRRYATVHTTAKFRPSHWNHFEETSIDRAVKAKLEEALHMTLPKWSMVVEGPRAVLYDPTPEMFQERRDELVELLQNGPPGPCDAAQNPS